MKIRNLGRKVVAVPAALGAALLWLFVFSVWIDHGKAREKAGPLVQVIAKQEASAPATAPAPEPAREPAKAELKPETAAQQPAQRQELAVAAPAAQRQAPAAELQAARSDLKRQGEAFMAAGHGLDDLPGIDGGAASVDEYLLFAQKAGYVFAIYSPEEKKYLGRLEFGADPSMVPLRLARGFSQKGRVVEHEALLRMAREVSGSQDVRVFAFCTNDWAAYLAGKIIEAMRICGISDRKDVAAFEAQFEVRGSRPVAVFKRAILSNGKAIAINDSEG